MRCLRQIGDIQETGLVFLSEENIKILDAELQENFKLSVDDLNKSGDDKQTVEIRLVPPPVKIKLQRVQKLHQIKEKKLNEGVDLKLNEADQDKYKITMYEADILKLGGRVFKEEDITYIVETI